jgi:hypothetical protein
MEPDGRIETNEKGFCRHHFEQLYNKQVNRLGLGLILETHIETQNKEISNIFDTKADLLKKEFSIPAELEPINILVIGYADTDNEPALSPDRHNKLRQPLSSTVSYEKL